MSSVNKRKVSFVVSIVGFLGCLAVVFQNFTANEPSQKSEDRTQSLHSAIGAALDSAQMDHSAHQVALNVDPKKIEESSFKRHQGKKVIVVDDNMSLDHGVEDTLPSGIEGEELEESFEDVDEISPL
jgi:hypothetical protein